MHARIPWWANQKHFLTCQCPRSPIISQVAIVQIAQGLVQVSCSLQSTTTQSPSIHSGTCLSGHARFQMISAINNPNWLFAPFAGVWRYWAPPLERSKLATTAFTGQVHGIAKQRNVCLYSLPLQFLRRCRVRLATERMAGLLRALVNALLHLWCKTNLAHDKKCFFWASRALFGQSSGLA